MHRANPITPHLRITSLAHTNLTGSPHPAHNIGFLYPTGYEVEYLKYPR